MITLLGDDDALAIDLLLDRSMSSNENSGLSSFMPPVGDNVIRRIGAAESVLRLIGQAPASDPAPDLVQRTLARIERHTGAQHPIHQPAPDLGQGRPHA